MSSFSKNCSHYHSVEYNSSRVTVAPPTTWCRCAQSGTLLHSGALRVLSLRCLRSSVNMEDELDVDIEGDEFENSIR